MKKKAMKFSVPVFVLQLCIVSAMLITGWLLFDKLPDQIPSHWNIEGQVDSYTDKGTAIYLFPGITLAIALLFPLLSRIDPRKEKYVLFRRPWLILQTAFVLFFAYMYFVTIYLTFHPEQSIERFIFIGIGVLFVVIGNYLGKVRQNYFIGIRTPWTLDNEEVWNKTQRIGGWAFLLIGLAVLIDAFFLWNLFAVMMIGTGVAILIPIFYSYFIHKKLTK